MLNPPPAMQAQPGGTVLMTASQLQTFLDNNGGSLRGLEYLGSMTHSSSNNSALDQL